MNPIVWLDTQILKFFNKIVKDINWLTGLDNIFLAILSFAVALFCIFLDSVILEREYISFVVLLGVYLSTFGMQTLSIIKDKNKEKLNGAKDIWLFIKLRMFRLSMSAIFLIYIFTDTPLLITITVFFLVSWAYFLSIDTPPYQRSQLWEKIKNWRLQLSPQAGLELAPIKAPTGRR